MKPLQWDELSLGQQSKFLSGNIKLEHWYHDDTVTHFKKFSINDVTEMIRQTTEKKQGISYGMTDTWMYESLELRPITGKSVAVMGSILPWYESMVLSFGGFPTTIEYNQTFYDHPSITQLTVSEYWKNPIKFDVAISISSFEHDGLGRYGDPIDPDGDLRAMREMKTILKKDGLLYLAVPTGMDKVVWNAHRIYGNIRLPLLLNGWEVVGAVGFDDRLINQDFGVSGVYQPVIVLKNI